MSCLVTNPTSQFINPYHGNPLVDAKIYIGQKDTDALVPANAQTVYLLGEDDSKTPIAQPLLTNGGGVIVYEGKPVTVWIDDAYSIVIIGVDGRQVYKSLYVEDPTYWLRRDLATLPTAEFPNMGVNLVAGAAPIDSPTFTGDPRAPTPPAGDKDTSIATTEFVTNAVNMATAAGVTGGFQFWLGITPPAHALLLDGSQLSKTNYAGLYAVIGDTYATANGLVPDSASFYLPDARARYIRCADNGAGRSASAVFMKYYNDTLKAHTHQNKFSGWEGDGAHRENGALLYGVWASGNDSLMTSESEGDAETMPMSLTFLPVVWAVNSSQSVSIWWEKPQHKTARPDVYHVDHSSGELLGHSPANPSPLEPGVWLTPVHATQTPPPASVAGAVRVFINNEWRQDTGLHKAREKAAQEEKERREKLNTLLMQAEERRTLIDSWLKAQAAPFTMAELMQFAETAPAETAPAEEAKHETELPPTIKTAADSPRLYSDLRAAHRADESADPQR